MRAPCWWLSFAGPEGSLGACIVPVPSGLDDASGPAGMVAATRAAWRLGCNPGGEVGGAPFDGAAPEGVALIQKWGVGRLNTAEELRAGGLRTLRELEEDEE